MSTQPKSKLHLTFSTTYRPPVAHELFSASVNGGDERQLLDGVSHNYNGHAIPPAALRNILTHRPVFRERNIRPEQVDMISGLVFVSERTGGLETLHVAFRVNGEAKPRVFELGELYGAGRFGGIRMEDSGRIAGDDFLVYVSTKKPASHRRMPWTAVYMTKLSTRDTWRLTPNEEADISPAVSPSGKKIAVATFDKKRGWNGEVEDLKTSLYVIDISLKARYLVVENGGWPSWGSDNVLFFHRKVGDNWVVFRAEPDPRNHAGLWRTTQVTPNGISAMTPAAIDANFVVVAVVRKFDKKLPDDKREKEHYRHIEIFRVGPQPGQGIPITLKSKPLADHFNPFIMRNLQGGVRIGYHRSQDKLAVAGSADKINSPIKDVEVRRVAGSFPTISKDGNKLAFVDNEFKSIYLVDRTGRARKIYEGERDSVFAPVWSKNPRDDTLFVCKGKSFKAKETVHIYAIENISTKPHLKQLTFGQSNNAFPTTNREGTQMVFRSTRDHGDKEHKNLYLMDNIKGDVRAMKLTRLTNGQWKDTHCDWSPNHDWIVFSSTRANPGMEHYAVYMLNIHHKDTVILVAKSADNGFGFLNHPFFSPDGKTLVVTSDLSAVSADPISLPFYLHSVRPYGDVFTIEIDPNRMENNRNLKNFRRVTHSRYENALATWAIIPQPAMQKAAPQPAMQKTAPQPVMQKVAPYNGVVSSNNVGSFNHAGKRPNHLRVGNTQPEGPLNSWGPTDYVMGAVALLGVMDAVMDAVVDSGLDPIDMMLSAIPMAFQQGGEACPVLRNAGQSVVKTGHNVVPSRGC